MRTYLIFTVILSVVLASCTKEMKLEELQFDVSPSNTNIATTESVKFNFTGNPDLITFYSGESGSVYEYRNRISDTSSNVKLRFSTATTTATNGALSLLVSTDLTGIISAASISKATWTNITSRAILATGTATVASGDVSLADFAVQRKPVYIAFRYTAAPAAIQRKWTITGLTLNHILPGKTYVIGDMTANTPSPGWVSADVKNTAVNWTAALVITGATTAASAQDTEDWMVMGPVDLSRVLPDAGVPIKNITEGMNKFPYEYKYTAAGTYNAVFEATNVNRDAFSASVKKITMTVR